MKLAIVGVSGREGTLLAEEALARKHQVTGFVRKSDATVPEGVQVIQKDILSIGKGDLAGFDAVLDAFGTWKEETLPLHVESCMHLCDSLAGTDVRLLVVGGAGSLYVDKSHTKRLIDTPDFPKAYYPMAKAQSDELDALRKRQDVRWTFLSPATEFVADGKRTGSYRLGGEELMLDADGRSSISYADFAIAMIDEAEHGNHIRQRISVIDK